MLLRAISCAVFVALSVTAIAVPAPSKTFKFQIRDPKRGLWYLADATGAGTQDASKALSCQLVDSMLTCGGQGFPDFYSDMTRLETAGNATGWSIDANDNIHWDALHNEESDAGNMMFSEEFDASVIMFSILGIEGDELQDTQWSVWAEICPHHWEEDQHGTAKAIWE